MDVLTVDQSAVLMEVNEAGDDIGVFGVVIRNFLPDSEVLQSAHLVAENCVGMGRDVRVSQLLFQFPPICSQRIHRETTWAA